MPQARSKASSPRKKSPRKAAGAKKSTAKKPKRAGRRRRADGGSDERKKDILRAATKVFADHGYHGCRISDVADQAGVAYGLVYHYFGNKDALLAALFEKYLTVFEKALSQICDETPVLEERLRQIIDLMLNAYEADPHAVKVLVVEFGRSSRLGDTLVSPELGGVFKVLERLFGEARDRGELREGVHEKSMVVIFAGAIEAALASFIMPRGPSGARPKATALARTRETLKALFCDGLLNPDHVA